MRPIVIVSQVALDERNGAGMRAIIPYLVNFKPESVHSFYLANYLGATSFREQTEPLIEVQYQSVHLINRRGFRLISLGLRANKVLLQNFSSKFRNDAVFLVVPDSIRDILLGLICRMWVKRLVVWVMDDISSPNQNIKARIHNHLLGRLYQKADRRIVVSEAMDQCYFKKFGKKSDLVLGRTLSAKRAPTTLKRKTGEPLKIIYLGSFLDYSAAPIRALARLIETSGANQFKLELYGMHPVPKSWGEQTTVLYKGSVPSDIDQGLALISKFDFALLPYNFDAQTIRMMSLSFPSKLIDYLGAAIPVITIAPGALPFIPMISAREIGPVVTAIDDLSILNLMKQVAEVQADAYETWSKNANRWADDFMFESHKLESILNGSGETRT